LIGRGQILKLGKRLAVGEVLLYSEGEPEPVAHVTCTYSIPPTVQEPVAISPLPAIKPPPHE
jgi:hypothetical protein